MAKARRGPPFLMLLPVLVLGFSTLLWWLVERGHLDLLGLLGTHNHGQLIIPVTASLVTNLKLPFFSVDDLDQ